MPRSPQRFLIVSASIGGGHVAAARALESVCLERGLEVKHVDALDYTSRPFRRLYRQTYLNLVRSAPDFVDWIGKRLDREPREQKNRQQRLRARLSRVISYYLPRLITRYQPDVIIHTHFLAPEIFSASSVKMLVPQAVVVTDFAAHSLWLQPNVKRYFVASTDVAAHLWSAGVETERVVVSGIPIDSRFRALETKTEARATLGVPLERDLLLIMAGGLSGRILLDLVSQLKALRFPLTVLIVCGRSEELVATVKRQIGDYEGLIHFRVVGFSSDVPHFMAAADLMVGKPGGLTSSEALAAGLPFAVVQPYPIQEEANANYLLEYGAGMRIEPLSLFNHKLKLFFEDEERRDAMCRAAKKIAHPNAAETVIKSLLEEPLRRG